MILAIECSGGHASVALVRGENLLCEKGSDAGRDLSEKLLPFIEEALGEGRIKLPDISHIGYSNGPGSYTGLRVGLATIKGLVAAVASIKVLPVGSLETLAFGSTATGLVAAVTDARRGEVYAALFECEGAPGSGRKIKTLEQPVALPATEWAECLGKYDRPVSFVGDGTEACREIWQKSLGSRFAACPQTEWVPRARWVAELARRAIAEGRPSADVEALVPEYVQVTRYVRVGE